MNQINMTKTHQARSTMSIVALIYCITFFAATSTTCAFTATTMLTRTTSLSKSQQQPYRIDNDGVTVVVLYGYLDNLSRDELYDTRGDPNPDLYAESREATQMSKDQVDRYGPGDLSQFVDFGDEFDGGDGQMGVAGDGNKGLEKEWDGAAQMAKSKSMSAKNAWGKSTGYAEQLVEQGMDISKAQQLENWKNQREVQEQRNAQKYMTDEFDNSKEDENWRTLGKFGGEQVQDVDLDQELGAVQLGSQLTGVIELTSRLNQASVYEFSIKNPFMGFSDYRARFTMMTNPADWSITPTDGSLNGRGSPQDFIVKFRPQSPSVSEGFLVIETEEDKWTYKLIGTASM